MMKVTASFLACAAALIFAQLACVCAPADPLGGQIHVFSSGEKGVEKQSDAGAVPVPQSPVQQPYGITQRYITVTEKDSIFSIGLPAGFREERQVTAQQPIDFWFEYLQSGMELTVDGQSVEIPERWSKKIGYTQRVNRFSYVMVNKTGQSQAYNLHMVPSQTGSSVQVETTEKWSTP
jgi:hypothetical protein